MLKNTIQQTAYRKIKIDENNFCEFCGNKERLLRHHSDYNKPLEVIILCDKCHSKWHKENKVIENNKVKNTFMSKFQLNFKGNKEQLHQQLKMWCKKADRTMNGTILELIEKHLKKINLISGRPGKEDGPKERL